MGFHGLFMDAYLGWPGKVQDARVFTNSSIYCKGVQDTSLLGRNKLINGVQVMYI